MTGFMVPGRKLSPEEKAAARATKRSAQARGKDVLREGSYTPPRLTATIRPPGEPLQTAPQSNK